MEVDKEVKDHVQPVTGIEAEGLPCLVHHCFVQIQVSSSPLMILMDIMTIMTRTKTAQLVTKLLLILIDKGNEMNIVKKTN